MPVEWRGELLAVMCLSTRPLFVDYSLTRLFYSKAADKKVDNGSAGIPREFIENNDTWFVEYYQDPLKPSFFYLGKQLPSFYPQPLSFIPVSH